MLLDVDDDYAPLALTKLLNAFKTMPFHAAIVMGIELVGCEREVHPLILKAATGSAPGNLLLRREVATWIGGFPTDPAFREQGGGEDIAFRTALRTWFQTGFAPDPLYRQRVRPGDHFHYFLDRARIEDGKLVVGAGKGQVAVDRATVAYLEGVRRRLSAVACLKREFLEPAAAAADGLVQRPPAPGSGAPSGPPGQMPD